MDKKRLAITENGELYNRQADNPANRKPQFEDSAEDISLERDFYYTKIGSNHKSWRTAFLLLY